MCKYTNENYKRLFVIIKEPKTHKIYFITSGKF